MELRAFQLSIVEKPRILKDKNASWIIFKSDENKIVDNYPDYAEY